MNTSFFLGSVAAAIGFFTFLKKFRFQQDTEDTISSSLSLPSPPTSLSLPSPSTSLSRTWKHNVFPSFHGADVRTTVLSHILESFKRKGIEPFIDNNIPRSKSIGPALKEAIRGSKIAIVLLSKNYASSSWCLDELVEIMKSREVLGQIVMTIFYEVEPTDIKKQTGDFGKAFRKTCKGKTKEHIERWRKALEDVATIAGEHSCKWNNEAAMIEKIATDVSNILNNSTTSRDFDGLVGMRTHIEEMEGLLRLDLDEVRMIGIWGPPGIGKTTIARVLFNQVSNRFQLGAIMVDIKGCYKRLCLDEYNAQLQLQNQMLSQILNHKDINISHLGVAQERLKGKKVLLVLDDVDQLGQLDALAQNVQWFGPGSRIIITTEDRRVLDAHRINHIYKVKFPSSDEAFQIFCMNAFGQKHPYDGFHDLAWEVRILAGDLPLGLKVLGSALKGMSKQEWEMTLPRLKTRLDKNIESIIKLSYDALDDEDKYLFLYIACFFNYEYTHKVEEILAKKLSSVGKGLHILAQKSLISIEDRMIRMHTLLEKFGRETSKKEFVHYGHAKRQLLVGARDICEVVNDDTIDCRRFIGIELILEDCSSLVELPSSIGNAINLRMVFLRRCSSLVELPSSIMKITYLEELNLKECSSLVKLPYSLGNATNLQKLNLSCCRSLVKIPSSIENATNLQILDLSDCSDLEELPSIGNTSTLEELNLTNCSSLMKLPSSINASNLRELFLRDCSRVVELPALENATNLRKLDLQNCSSLQELHPSIGTATNLQELDIIGCSSLVKLPSSIGDLTNLKYFYLRNCSSLVELPFSIGNLQKLFSLQMCGCSKLEALPTNINLESLSELDLTDCSKLKSFPEVSTNINWLRLTGTAIEKGPLSIGSYLSYFEMSYFESLKEFPHALDIITELHFVNEDIKEVPPWVKGMSRLRKLRLYNCNNLVSLPQFSDLLSDLVAENCQSLERLDCSFNDPDICLEFVNCLKLNHEARDLIMHTSTLRYAMLPGTEVPDCFNHRATGGGYLTIKLNESQSLPTSLRFKACIMLVKDEEEWGDDEVESGGVNIDIMDKQKNLKVCKGSRQYIKRLLTEHIYTFEFEAEEMTSTELLFDFKSKNSKWKIIECGILSIDREDSKTRI